jgi:hypothetical protein
MLATLTKAASDRRNVFVNVGGFVLIVGLVVVTHMITSEYDASAR